ncbi:MAG: hypothetical protein U1F53_02825 [Burkholderiaceae bacterium]
MNLNTTKTGLAVAAAAAALFTLGAAPLAAQAADASVKCAGVNSCKGTSECKTAKSECKGQNSCKGQGWVSKKTADECTKAGGTVVKG